MTWQDFSTAPRDGTTILAHFKNYGVCTVNFRNRDHDSGCWYTDGGEITGYLPTHWMPLPDAPGESGQSTDPARIEALESVARDALVELVNSYANSWRLLSWGNGRALVVWNRMRNGLPNEHDSPFHPELVKIRHLSELTGGWVTVHVNEMGFICGKWVPMDEWKNLLTEEGLAFE